MHHWNERVGEKVDPLVGAAEVAAILRLSHPSSVTTYLRRYPDYAVEPERRLQWTPTTSTLFQTLPDS